MRRHCSLPPEESLLHLMGRHYSLPLEETLLYLIRRHCSLPPEEILLYLIRIHCSLSHGETLLLLLIRHCSIVISSGPEVSFVNPATPADHSNMEWFCLRNVNCACLPQSIRRRPYLIKIKGRRFWIHGISFDDGMVLLMVDEDVINLLNYVLVIEEIVEDNIVSSSGKESSVNDGMMSILYKLENEYWGKLEGNTRERQTFTFEKAEKERDDLKLTLEKFENSSKNLSKPLEIQVSDKFKTGVGYDTQVVDSQVFDSQVNDKYKTGEGYHASITSVPAVATSKVKTSESKPKSVSEPLIEDWISDSEDENETQFKSKQKKPSFAKVEFVKSNEHVKIPRESVEKVENNKQAKYPRKNSQSPRDCDFYEKKMVEKHVWNNASRVNHQNSQRLTHPHPKGNFVPKAVLMKSGHKTLNTARKNSSKAVVSVNTAKPINTTYLRPTVNSARKVSNVFNRAHSHVRRPFNKFTTNKNSNLNEIVNTVRRNVTTVESKAVVSNNKGNEANAVKASACWVWRPKLKVLDHVSRHNGASMNFKRFYYADAQGRSKSIMAWVPKRA
ncbi:hypothetical protein Tco_0040187 [Tanacetum coccineum]